MISYGQFCPVAKTAEIIGGRWTPLILRDLCFGPKTFGELLNGIPLISRTVLSQRLKELILADVIHGQAGRGGKGRIYRLTEAGEDLRPMIRMMGDWGLRWGQGHISADDLDPKV